jgi:hypothetical protein
LTNDSRTLAPTSVRISRKAFVVELVAVDHRLLRRLAEDQQEHELERRRLRKRSGSSDAEDEE